MSRKAQLSLVLIVVAVMVLGGFILYWYSFRSAPTIDPELGEEQRLTAEQIKVKDVVDFCLKEISLEGLEIIRLQGGYIYVDNLQTMEYMSKEKHVSREEVPRILNGTGKTRIVWWSTAEKTVFPSIEVMEHELAKYIASKMPACVDNFNSIREEGWVVDAKDPLAFVQMSSAVRIGLDYPITIRHSGITALQSFEYAIPINMQEIRSLAEEITVHEHYANYLEIQVKKWLSYYQGVDESTTWYKEEVQKKVSGIIQAYTSELKLEGTASAPANYPIEESKIAQGFIENFLTYDYQPMSVRHTFDPSLEWEFDIYPSDGEAIRPDKVLGKRIPFLPQICVFKYAYKYFVTYPVMVELYDPNSASIDIDNARAIEKGGFLFMFPVQVLICGNQNRECRSLPQYVRDVEEAVNQFGEVGFLPDTNYCRNSKALLQLDITATSSKGPLPGVDIQFQCGASQSVCALGKTNLDGTVKVHVPSCINGLLTAAKEGYRQETRIITSAEDKVEQLALMLTHEASINITVEKIDISEYIRQAYQNNDLTPRGTKLGDDEKVIISIPSLQEKGVIMYPLSNQLMAAPGNYEVQTLMISTDYSTFTLPNGESVKGVVPSPMMSLHLEIPDEENRSLIMYVWDARSSNSLAAFVDEENNIHAKIILKERVTGYRQTEPVCDSSSSEVKLILPATQAYELLPCETEVPFTITKEEYQGHIAPGFTDE